MTDASLGIHVRIDSTTEEKALERLARAAANPQPAFQQIGEYMDLATRERFDTQTGPDGQSWEPLSEVTIARRRKRGRKSNATLVDSGNLRDLLRYLVTNDGLEFGSDRPYAGVQQFGASKGQFGKSRRGGPIPWGDIPARPFLGLSEVDKEEVQFILRDYLEGSLAA